MNYFAYYSIINTYCINGATIRRAKLDDVRIRDCLRMHERFRKVLAANFVDSCRWRAPAYRRFIALANPVIVGASEIFSR